MSAALRYTLVSLRAGLMTAGPFALLALALLVLAYWWLDPTPPRRVVLATGPAQSAYDEFGKRYQKALAANGIEVVLLRSEGSSENLELLRSGKADLGFVQAGSDAESVEEDSQVQSLGKLFLEPVWLFYRNPPGRKAPITSLSGLVGLRVNVGTPGSGVPALIQRLLEANRIDPATLQLLRLDQTPATVAFLAGELDAIVFASAPESLMVQMLLQTPGVQLMDFALSEAYARRLPFLNPVVLPRGVVDIARDWPPQDVRLVASTTSLLTRNTTHPALQQLFAIASRDLHGKAGWFHRARTFPSADPGEHPLSREAERTLHSGPPLLQRWLPFWLANLVERMWLALGLILAILLPLSRVVPPLYQFRIRSRVFRWYGQLQAIEQGLAQAPGHTREWRDKLDQLEQTVARIEVPLSYSDELFALRSNIELVRRKWVRD